MELLTAAGLAEGIICQMTCVDRKADVYLVNLSLKSELSPTVN